MYLGAHVGVSGGLAEAVHDGRHFGCDSLQIFSKSPQMWAGPPIATEAATAFREAVVAEQIRATAVHHGYLLNLANPKPFLRNRSCRAFADEVQRAELLGVDALIFHPGAHLGSGVDAGVTQIAKCLEAALDDVPEGKVRLLLENSAGQGSTLGSKFEEIAGVLDKVHRPDRLGVTLDTCHLFAAGNDFRTPEGYGQMIDRIEATFGTRNVRAFHLNDAQAALGSHLDRHQNIGKGEIGLEGFRNVVTDPRWAEVPGYLETPLDDDDYARYIADLATLRSLLGPAAAPSPAGESPPPKKRRASTVK
jgi:deoxyribonuclease IV